LFQMRIAWRNTMSNCRVGNEGKISADAMGRRCEVAWVDVRRYTAAYSPYKDLSSHVVTCHCSGSCELPNTIRHHQPHLLCFEFDIPRTDELLSLSRVKRCYPQLPLLMLTEQHSEELAVWAFRTGVREYVVSPVPLPLLVRTIQAIVDVVAAGGARGYRSPLLFESLPRSWLESTNATSPRQRTLPALAHIANHLAQHISLDTVARLCGMTRYEFSRVFHREQGFTFSEYLLRSRVAKAKDLLIKPGAAVKQVAFDVGFTDLSYFSRIFKRYSGMAPSHFISCIPHGDAR
jgi:two-component system response regulator YesN